MTKTVTPTTLEYLTANDWALIQSKANAVAFRDGQPLIRAAHPVLNLYVILKGPAQVLVQGKTIAKLNAGAICGDMSFVEGNVASASVVAEGDLEAAQIPAGQLRELFETFPHLGLRFYRSVAVTLSKRLRATSQELSNARNGKH